MRGAELQDQRGASATEAIKVHSLCLHMKGAALSQRSEFQPQVPLTASLESAPAQELGKLSSGCLVPQRVYLAAGRRGMETMASVQWPSRTVQMCADGADTDSAQVKHARIKSGSMATSTFKLARSTTAR